MNSVLVGTLGMSSTPLVFAGGNCSIQGFNAQGDDDFWTVSTIANSWSRGFWCGSDLVRALILLSLTSPIPGGLT